jgi:hypothetical protein
LALGATKSDIFFQFLFEAVVISVLGCFSGVMAGWQGTQNIALRADLTFFFDLGERGAYCWICNVLESGFCADSIPKSGATRPNTGAQIGVTAGMGAKPIAFMVPERGLEPPRPCDH